MKRPETDAPRPQAVAPAEPRLGLRLRLWLACITGGCIAGFGSMWVLGTRVQPGATDPAQLLAWLAAVAFAAVVSGLLLAAWLDHHIVGQLRVLVRALQTGRVSELRGLPSSGGWGELAELSEAVQELLSRQRAAGRAAEEIEQLRGQLAAMQFAADRWISTETWDAPVIEHGALAELNETLARGFSRRTTVDEQNRDAADQVAGELASALADAQESATQAERGFVEATAMLTTVRELQRLSAELQAPLDLLAPAADGGAGDGGAAATGAREAIEELVEASQSSVAAIGRAMLRVHDVSAQVQTLSNRATLIAIQVVSSTTRETGAGGDELGAELKQLARDVREITDRTNMFAMDIEASVTEAAQHMGAARARALARLESAPVAAPAAGRERAFDDAQRLLERVREMVQDAARKGERLSAAGERTSRAAERLSRRIEAESAEAAAMRVRLAPVGEVPAAASPARLRLIPVENQQETRPGIPAAEAPPRAPREEEGRP